MSFRAKQSWPRRAALAGAVLAATALAVGVLPQPAMAQYAYDYGYGYPGRADSYSPHSNPYHQPGRWGAHDSGWHRGWAEGGRGHGAWGHAGRGNEGFSGSSSGGRGGGYAVHGSRAGGRIGGSGNGYVNWLGAHARLAR
jgi:hypothetical protein